MSDLYGLIKIVHIVSSTVLFGTGLGTAFQMWMVHRSRNVVAIAMVARNVVRADWIFTTPAVVVQPLSGFALMYLAGIDPFASWLVVAYGLYLVTGACWLPVIWIQIRVRDIAVSAVAENNSLPQVYHRLMNWWFWLGCPAFASVLTIFWLMIARPALW